MTRETPPQLHWQQCVATIVGSVALVLASSFLRSELRELNERTSIRAEPSGGELEALRQIPSMEAELRDLEVRRAHLSGL